MGTNWDSWEGAFWNCFQPWVITKYPIMIINTTPKTLWLKSRIIVHMVFQMVVQPYGCYCLANLCFNGDPMALWPATKEVMSPALHQDTSSAGMSLISFTDWMELPCCSLSFDVALDTITKYVVKALVGCGYFEKNWLVVGSKVYGYSTWMAWNFVPPFHAISYR